MKSEKFTHSTWMILIAIILYSIGLAFMPSESIDQLRSKGIADQEEYTYIDSEGEEHDDKTLISIDGLGYVLTYKTVYVSPITAFIPILIFGRLLYGKSQNELKTIILGLCIIGMALILLTTNSHIVSTLFFWLGIATASFCIETGERQTTSNHHA